LKPGFPRAEVNKVEIEELVEFKYIQSWDEMLKHLNENWEVFEELDHKKFIMMRLK
jgi:hypothetical protein